MKLRRRQKTERQDRADTLQQVIERGDRTMRQLIDAFWVNGSRPTPGLLSELVAVRVTLRDSVRAQQRQAASMDSLVWALKRLIDRSEIEATIITDEQMAEVLKLQKDQTGQKIQQLLLLTSDLHQDTWPLELVPVAQAINELAVAFLCRS